MARDLPHSRNNHRQHRRNGSGNCNNTSFISFFDAVQAYRFFDHARPLWRLFQTNQATKNVRRPRKTTLSCIDCHRSRDFYFSDCLHDIIFSSAADRKCAYLHGHGFLQWIPLPSWWIVGGRSNCSLVCSKVVKAYFQVSVSIGWASNITRAASLNRRPCEKPISIRNSAATNSLPTPALSPSRRAHRWRRRRTRLDQRHPRTLLNAFIRAASTNRRPCENAISAIIHHDAGRMHIQRQLDPAGVGR